MTVPESTKQAIEIATTFRRFCLAVIEHDRTDKQRYLSEAISHRITLINSGRFTSDYLDGLADGLRGGFLK